MHWIFKNYFSKENISKHTLKIWNLFYSLIFFLNDKLFQLKMSLLSTNQNLKLKS